ncbi:MAG TPA: BON domain-containing protein [Alphaproteobacteria bacterium]|nr:BON domain-containing protein [Alphaproteobacteria bacterium]
MAIAAGLPLAGAAAPLSTGGAPFDDRALADAVEDELAADPLLPAEAIDVAVRDGAVRLGGTVPSLRVARLVERTAETVRGVRSVEARIEVVPPAAEVAERLRRDVEAALMAARPTLPDGLAVTTDEAGRVVLDGQVRRAAERRRYGDLAAAVRGVTAVENRLRVAPPAMPPDEALHAAIARRLRDSRLIGSGDIAVAVADGVASLSGRVGSLAERRVAAELAEAAGALAVRVEALAVDPGRGGPGGEAARDDEAVARAVEAALADSASLEGAAAEVAVEEGVVTLRGGVPTLAGKRIAARLARLVAGVVRVENRLKVRPEQEASNEVVIAQALDALARDPLLAHDEIAVDAAAGTVYLTGSVDGFVEKALAEAAVSRLSGVIAVDNDIAVLNPNRAWVADPYVLPLDPLDYDWYDYRPGSTLKSDAEIAAAIDRQLRWSPFVDPDRIAVAVEGGHAILRGEGLGWAERRAAVENAIEGGALSVEDRLAVAGSD